MVNGVKQALLHPRDGLAVHSHTAAIAVGLTRIRVDRDRKGDLRHAGLTKPAHAYFGYLKDCASLRPDAIFLQPCCRLKRYKPSIDARSNKSSETPTCPGTVWPFALKMRGKGLFVLPFLNDQRDRE